MHAGVLQSNLPAIHGQADLHLADVGAFARGILHPRGGEHGLDFADGGDDRRRLGLLAPRRHAVPGFLHQIPASCLDEIAGAIQRLGEAILLTVQVWLDQGLDPVALGEQLVLAPMFLEQAVQCLAIAFTAFRQLVKAIGDPALGLDRDRRAEIEVEHATLAEQRVRSPRHEVEPIRLRVEINEKVVRVAGVAVPKTKQPLDGPEPVKRIEIDEPADGFLARLLALEQLDQLPDFFAARFVVAAFVLEAALPVLVKIHYRTLVKRAGIVAEPARQQRLAHRLHVRVDAEVFAVDRHLGKGAARRRRPGLVENRIPHVLAHDGAVLLVVVHRQVGQPADGLLLVGVVELDLERRPAAALRADEPLLAQADLFKLHAVNRHVGIHVFVRAVDRLYFPALVQRRDEVARLMAYLVPVLFGNGDLHVEHAFGREQFVERQFFVRSQAGGGQHECSQADGRALEESQVHVQ